MSFQLVMDSGSRCMYRVRAASDKELTNCCSSHAASLEVLPHCAMKCAMCSYGSPTTGELFEVQKMIVLGEAFSIHIFVPRIEALHSSSAQTYLSLSFKQIKVNMCILFDLVPLV